MILLEAARQALPGIAWEQVSSNGVEYVYGEGSKDSYGVFDLADIAKITAELKADRDALDADLDETPRAVLTDELTALRERMRWVPVGERLPRKMGNVEIWRKMNDGTLAPGIAFVMAGSGWWVDTSGGRWAPGMVTHWRPIDAPPLPAAPEVQNG